jgi:hypothetical protein
MCVQCKVYQEGAVPRGEGDDVGAGDDAGADGLDGGLDLVDDLVAADGVDVGAGALLADEAADVVQKNRGVAALMTPKFYLFIYLPPVKFISIQMHDSEFLIQGW